MSRTSVALISVALGAVLTALAQEFHLWRQHRRRFDEARRVAYTNLMAQAFRLHNAFALTWSPAAFYYGRQTYLGILDDMIAAVAAARLVASKPVHEAAGELMDAVNAVVELATNTLARDARFGFIGWHVLGFKPMPVSREPGLDALVDKLGAATTRFVVAAQEEIKVPPRRQRQRGDQASA